VAEWLRNGLQNRVPRFNSGRGLQPFAHAVPQRLVSRSAAKAARAGYRELRLGRPDDPRRNPTTPREFCGVWRFQCGAAFVICAPTHTSRLFPGSSVVEQPAVNRLVAGSNPARGANSLFSSVHNCSTPSKKPLCDQRLSLNGRSRLRMAVHEQPEILLVDLLVDRARRKGGS
jgi:hypothetical protein